MLADVLTPPPLEHIDRAFSELHGDGLLTAPSDDGDLTSIGSFVSALGLDLRLGRLVGLGCVFGCLPEAIALAAVVNAPKSPFRIATELVQKDPADYSGTVCAVMAGRHRLDCGVASEPLMLLNLLYMYRTQGRAQGAGTFSAAAAGSAATGDALAAGGTDGRGLEASKGTAGSLRAFCDKYGLAHSRMLQLNASYGHLVRRVAGLLEQGRQGKGVSKGSGKGGGKGRKGSGDLSGELPSLDIVDVPFARAARGAGAGRAGANSSSGGGGGGGGGGGDVSRPGGIVPSQVLKSNAPLGLKAGPSPAQAAPQAKPSRAKPSRAKPSSSSSSPPPGSDALDCAWAEEVYLKCGLGPEKRTLLRLLLIWIFHDQLIECTGCPKVVLKALPQTHAPRGGTVLGGGGDASLGMASLGVVVALDPDALVPDDCLRALLPRPSGPGARLEHTNGAWVVDCRGTYVAAGPHVGALLRSHGRHASRAAIAAAACALAARLGLVAVFVVAKDGVLLPPPPRTAEPAPGYAAARQGLGADGGLAAAVAAAQALKVAAAVAAARGSPAAGVASFGGPSGAGAGEAAQGNDEVWVCVRAAAADHELLDALGFYNAGPAAEFAAHGAGAGAGAGADDDDDDDDGGWLRWKAPLTKSRLRFVNRSLERVGGGAVVATVASGTLQALSHGCRLGPLDLELLFGVPAYLLFFRAKEDAARQTVVFPLLPGPTHAEARGKSKRAAVRGGGGGGGGGGNDEDSIGFDLSEDEDGLQLFRGLPLGVLILGQSSKPSFGGGARK